MVVAVCLLVWTDQSRQFSFVRYWHVYTWCACFKWPIGTVKMIIQNWKSQKFKVLDPKKIKGEKVSEIFCFWFLIFKKKIQQKWKTSKHYLTWPGQSDTNREGERKTYACHIENDHFWSMSGHHYQFGLFNVFFSYCHFVR